MSARRNRAVVPFVAALVFALGGVALLAVGRGAGDQAGRAAAPRSASPADATGLRLRSTTPQPTPTGLPVAAPVPGAGAIPDPTDSATLADPLAGPVPDTYLQALLDAAPSGEPTEGSDTLPAATRNPAADAAGRALVADLSGAGRSEFAGFWTEPAHSVWSRVRVQASTAQTAGLDPPRVAATLIWAGTSPTGERVERRRTVVTVELTDDGWWPISVG